MAPINNTMHAEKVWCSARVLASQQTLARPAAPASAPAPLAPCCPRCCCRAGLQLLLPLPQCCSSRRCQLLLPLSCAFYSRRRPCLLLAGCARAACPSRGSAGPPPCAGGARLPLQGAQHAADHGAAGGADHLPHGVVHPGGQPPGAGHHRRHLRPRRGLLGEPASKGQGVARLAGRGWPRGRLRPHRGGAARNRSHAEGAARAAAAAPAGVPRSKPQWRRGAARPHARPAGPLPPP